MKKNFLIRIKEGIETYLPMTLGNFLIFLGLLYFLFIVGKTTWTNYQSNKSILEKEKQILAQKQELDFMQNQINYFQTKSFAEKEARAKLGYKAPGESMMSLPLDQPEQEDNTTVVGPAKVRVPNYQLWWEYFFGESS